MEDYNLIDIQKVELQILEQVKTICDKHNLKYFADSGTLLGIVRNNKFIPWDNDIDLAMLRSDYEKFIQYADNELQYPYYLQTAYKDKGYYSGLIKIRKSDTTAILKSQLHSKTYNQGIFLDIFPLDKTINNKFLSKIQLKFLFFVKKQLQLKERKKLNLVTKSKLLKIFLIITYPITLFSTQKSLYRLFENIGKLGNLTNSNNVDKVLFRGYHNSNKLKLIPLKCYNSSKIVKFEDTMISIPEDSDSVLRTIYGNDYMIPKKEPDSHGDVIFDINKSYLEYLNNKEQQ